MLVWMRAVSGAVTVTTQKCSARMLRGEHHLWNGLFWWPSRQVVPEREGKGLMKTRRRPSLRMEPVLH